MNILGRIFGSKRAESTIDDDVRAKVRAVDDRLHDLERSFKQISLEWEETYDKVTHLMARITKRAKIPATSTAQDASTDENGTTPATAPLPLSGFQMGTHSRLQEMRRRMNGVLPR